MKENLFTEFSYLFTHRYAFKDKCVINVVYIYKGTCCVTLPLHIKKEEGHDFSEKAYYVDKARRIVQKMIKDGSLNSYSKKYAKDKKDNKLLKILTSVVGVYGLAGIAVGIFFACYKPAPKTVYKAEIDAPAGIVFSNAIVKVGEDFSTKIFINDTAKEKYYVLPNNLTSVTSNGEEITNYTYTLDEDAHTANFVVPKESVKGNLSVAMDIYRPNLCFTAIEPNSTVGYSVGASVQVMPEIESSLDEINWTSWDGEDITLANEGDKLYVRNKIASLSDGWYVDQYVSFSTSGKLDVSGNIMSMVNYDNLPDFCFAGLFFGCDAVINASQLTLPATTLSDSCYYRMFENCSSLLTAPRKLPATILTRQCYNHMFEGCSSLVTAPYLPPATEVYYHSWYNSMFNNCSSLYISTEGGTEIFTTPEDVSSNYSNMFGNTLGHFEIHPDGNPEPLTTYYFDTEPTELCVKAIVASSSISFEGDDDSLQYSLNGKTWSSWDGSSIMLGQVGARIYVRNTSSTLSDSFKFNMSGEIALRGNIMSLLNNGSLYEGCFKKLFYNCDGLIDARAVVMPENTEPYCYQQMFEDCDYFKFTPYLPATTLSEYCYDSMFKNCSQLAIQANSRGGKFFTCPEVVPEGAVNDMILGTFNTYCQEITPGYPYSWWDH